MKTTNPNEKFTAGVNAALLTGVRARVGLRARNTQPSPTEKRRATGRRKRDAAALAPLAWLEGCWGGNVNLRDFREQWMPLRGKPAARHEPDRFPGKTHGYEYLRLEPRPDAIYYVASPLGQARRWRTACLEQRVDRKDR